MKRKKQKRREGALEASGRMFEIATELRALGYLVRMQRLDETPPLDIEEIHAALGKRIEHLALKLREIREALDGD